jgi:hypothetical protein
MSLIKRISLAFAAYCITTCCNFARAAEQPEKVPNRSRPSRRQTINSLSTCTVSFHPRKQAICSSRPRAI